MRFYLLPALATLLTLAALAVTPAEAQSFGQSGPGGYGPGNGPGYSGGYGMMGGRGYGMMGGGYGQGYSQGNGPGGGYSRSQNAELTFTQAMRTLESATAPPVVDRAAKTVTFSGARVFVGMAAVQPSYPDTTFEVAGLVDPTIVIPAGSTVTLSLVNMDYGRDMDHGVEITSVAPPYPVLGMMGIPDAVGWVPILAPRSAEDLQSARYAASRTTFKAPPPGVYYYLCQYSDHASKGMYGKLIVSGS